MATPKAIAFFPWVITEAAVDIGPIRLLPYQRGKKPGDLKKITQSEIDDVLSAYANHPNKTIKKATIIETNKWKTGTNAKRVIHQLFRARDAIAFSSLSQRKFFNNSFNYCNYDTFELIIQQYQPLSAKNFAFTTRRRDGLTQYSWSSNEFAFHRPYHVHDQFRLAPDIPFLEAIFNLDPSTSEKLYNSLFEFCCANTDSPNIPEHIEVVMIKSAFEWLLEINQQADKFRNELIGAIGSISSPPQNGPLVDNWKKSRPTATRPLEAWAREFCDIRGEAAHGSTRSNNRFVWDIKSHLIFSAILFPLIFKKKLSSISSFKMSNHDLERLKLIEQYLIHNPFNSTKQSPWINIENSAIYSTITTLTNTP